MWKCKNKYKELKSDTNFKINQLKFVVDKLDRELGGIYKHQDAKIESSIKYYLDLEKAEQNKNNKVCDQVCYICKKPCNKPCSIKDINDKSKPLICGLECAIQLLSNNIKEALTKQKGDK